MKIILKKDYKELGKILDVVNVKDGFARNFLLPSGIALPATDGNMSTVEEVKRLSQKRDEKKSKEANQLAKKIEDVPCTIPVKVKKDEEIYGSVSAHEISEFLIREGFKIEKTAIELEEPIKQLGVYSVKIKVYKDIFAKLKVWVVKGEDNEKAE